MLIGREEQPCDFYILFSHRAHGHLRDPNSTDLPWRVPQLGQHLAREHCSCLQHTAVDLSPCWCSGGHQKAQPWHFQTQYVEHGIILPCRLCNMLTVKSRSVAWRLWGWVANCCEICLEEINYDRKQLCFEHTDVFKQPISTNQDLRLLLQTPMLQYSICMRKKKNLFSLILLCSATPTEVQFTGRNTSD